LRNKWEPRLRVSVLKEICQDYLGSVLSVYSPNPSGSSEIKSHGADKNRLWKPSQVSLGSKDRPADCWNVEK
jgi:hypothetical protein